MGRPERPLDPSSSPVAAFAHELRLVRAAAGTPTYAAMARRAHRAASTLAEAAGGRSWPTLDTVLAYLTACDARPETLAQWERRWRKLDADLAARQRQAGQARDGETPDADIPPVAEASVPVAVSSTRPRRRRRGLARPSRRLAALGGLLVLVATLPLLGARLLGSDSGPDREPGARATSALAFPAASARANGSPSAAAQQTLTITSPATGSTVSLLDDVTIRRTGTAPGEYVWITIVFEGGVIVNPQGPCETDGSVTYTCAKAQFADPESPKGTTLHLRAVLVDEEGNLALQSLVASGYSAQAPPVPFLAESPGVVVLR
jgi:hypothetical protein